jgi:hypothetical protein
MERKLRIRERRPSGQRPIPAQGTSTEASRQSGPSLLPSVVTFRYAKRLIVCHAGWTAAGHLRTVEFSCPLCWTRILACAYEGGWISMDPKTGGVSIAGCVRCASPCLLHLHIDGGVATEFPSIFLCARDGSPW